MREPRSSFSAHQEIILGLQQVQVKPAQRGLSSVSIRQSHQRPPKAPQKPLKRACLSLVQTGLLLVGFAILGAMLAA